MPLMALATGTRLGSYEVLPLLCKGGMGEVYRACDAALKLDVAIKILGRLVHFNKLRRRDANNPDGDKGAFRLLPVVPE